MGHKRGTIAYHLINAAVFILLEIAALVMLQRNGEMQARWFMRNFHAVNAKLWGTSESIRHYFHLKEENEALLKENFELSQKLRAVQSVMDPSYAGYYSENIGPNAEINGFRYLPASIVKHSRNKMHNYFIINRGSGDGIEAGDGVVTAKGTVGIISSTSMHYSYVMAFTNTECIISARLGHEGSIGPLSWDGLSQKGALLKEIPCHIEVNPGDTVFTSGYSSIFPPDIPLGLTGESKIINGATFEIKIELFEEFSEVRYVTVVSNTARKEISKLEEEQ